MQIIQAPVKANDIVTIKIVGGEEIIGKLVRDIQMDYIEINRPLVVMLGQQAFGLMPFMLTAEPNISVKFDRTHVLGMAKTLDEVAKQYIKQTTGIQI